MNEALRSLIGSVAGGLALLGATSGVLEAQGRRGQDLRRTQAIIAVPQHFPYPGADAVVLRRTTQLPKDVILLRSERVEAGLLSSAVRTLLALRATFGDDPQSDGVFRVTSSSAPWTRDQEAKDWAGALASARVDSIPGIGAGRHFMLYLPNQRPR